nr:13E12 repeat family protein [Mycobacterium sherrisii]
MAAEVAAAPGTSVAMGHSNLRYARAMHERLPAVPWRGRDAGRCNARPRCATRTGAYADANPHPCPEPSREHCHRAPGQPIQAGSASKALGRFARRSPPPDDVPPPF